MKRSKLFSRMFALLMCASILTTAASATEAEEQPPAAGAHQGRIEVLRMVDDAAVKDAAVSIYRVATLVDGKPTWTEEYAEYQLTLKPDDETSFANLPQNLVTVIQRDQKEALATAKTNEEGKVAFTELEDGIYLVTGQRYQYNGYNYDQVPMLIFLPFLQDDQTAGMNANVEAKHTASRIPTGGGSTPTVSRRVLKVWNDEDNTESRPESVTVQLLNGDTVVDTEVLSADNDWRFTWTNLSQSGNWSVAEVSVAENYSVSIRQEGVTFVVTNTLEEDLEEKETPKTETPEESHPVEETLPPVQETPGPEEDIRDNETPLQEGLPQTGQLWIPVILCSAAGIVFVLAGMIMKKKEQSVDEA